MSSQSRTFREYRSTDLRV